MYVRKSLYVGTDLRVTFLRQLWHLHFRKLIQNMFHHRLEFEVEEISYIFSFWLKGTVSGQLKAHIALNKRPARNSIKKFKAGFFQECTFLDLFYAIYCRMLIRCSKGFYKTVPFSLKFFFFAKSLLLQILDHHAT